MSELGEGTGIHVCNVGRVLKVSGLDPMYGHLTRKVTPQYKKEAIRRAFKVKMSGPDIAYFLDVKVHIVKVQFDLFKEKRKVKGFIKIFKGKKFLNYRVSSQIYKAQDNGFDKENIIKNLDINYDTYYYAVKNRKVIGGEIINTLKLLYLDENIDIPYLPQRLNSSLYI